MFKTGKDVKKTFRFLLIGGVLMIVAGVYWALLLLLNPTPPYEELQESRIVVKEVKCVYGFKGSSFHGLKTADGERYHISGDHNWPELQEKLVEGTEITVKWHSKDKLKLEQLFIEEIVLDGEVICTYTENNDVGVILACISLGTMTVIGIGFFIFYRITVKKEIMKLPKKRRNI